MIPKTCPDCGAHLDSGERCDCKKERPPRSTAVAARESQYEYDSMPRHQMQEAAWRYDRAMDRFLAR